MQPLSRRRTISLASSFAALSLLRRRADAQAAPGAATFEMASFLGPGADVDAAFAKAIAAIEKEGGDAAKGGGPIHIAFNLQKNATYRIKRPLAFRKLDGFELNGNGAQLINTTRDSTLQISASSHVTIRDLIIDYDPLPFTQGTIVSFDKKGLQITVKVDPGYPDDSAFLATITDGFFRVMDRKTKALKAGARDFITPAKIERLSPGLIEIHLRWGANDCFPSQLPVAVGDVVTIANSYAHAIAVDGSTATSFIDVKLFASPGMGLLENGGAGSMMLNKVSIVPGPRPKGASADRLISTNSDGSHFITVERGPTFQDCTFANTSDDAVNVHGFCYYVLAKPAPKRYLLTPKWDIGLAVGDEIESCDHASFRSLGRTRLDELRKRHAPELKERIAQLWKNRSPPTEPDLVYEAMLRDDLPLKVGDSITSLSRIGAGTAVRRSSFHACGRVLVKAPNAIVEDCQFTYSSGVALQAGSDIGFWSESGFAENLILRNNRFSHSATGANELIAGNGALGAIYVGMSAPEGAKGFQNNFQNRTITIAGNHIDDSYPYAIFVSNADGVQIIDNAIGQTFIRGSAFDAGQLYGIKPDSAICIGRSRNVTINNNTVARGKLVKIAAAVDGSCDKASVHLGNNRLV
ncbi:MAG: right-handed parallel beta-helix repeat-containing protein [Bradyrhizobium sp.]|uniref:right-handed parallel beta-helix repeat-containing protein n=1 Tax=Bradyrhizobium sp. TaxID=376 RepID=UPI001D9CB81E|nr:right-handed parallel beta-helix repeat-containing protein [Bradyrhizobium sp.]MBV9565015.1 right-handed parallel beta-helix repeat-containing protein [Bradyrhizobium sp.]